MNQSSYAIRQGIWARRDLAIDHLRSTIIVLVLAHHAALAYTTFSIWAPERYTWSTAPIVDGVRWWPLDVLVSFNDIYFMTLMFFLSGLFVPGALDKRGTRAFLSERARRLAIPFAAATCLLMPLAYYPSWRLGSTVEEGFLPGFFTVEQWPVGPPWFLWVLLVFCFIAAALYEMFPRRSSSTAQLSSSPLLVPATFMIAIVSVAPIRLLVDPSTWSSLGGPFDVQVSRIPLYLASFLLGVYLGRAHRPLSSLVDKHYWAAWLLLAITSYAAHQQLPGVFAILQVDSWVVTLVTGTIFATCCAASCIAAIAIAYRFLSQPMRAAASFSQCAFGIYLVHYPIVTWLQYFLLPLPLAAALKFAIVLISTVLLSWGVVIGLRRTRLRVLLG